MQCRRSFHNWSLRLSQRSQHSIPRIPAISRRNHILLFTRTMTEMPRIISEEELSASEARWVTLKKVKYRDQEGRERLWEVAERKTRGSSGVDGVAILAILQPKDGSPPATIIIEQFRPPVGEFVIELPAGLLDEGESAEAAAVRELGEETGFKAEGVIDSSYLLVNDPGMSSANMKLVALRVPVASTNGLEEELPKQMLDKGEFIVRRVVNLSRLHQELAEYSKKGFVIDARLAHFAIGYDTAVRLAKGEML